MLVKVVGSKTTIVIFMGDMWKARTQWDSRYLWMPLPGQSEPADSEAVVIDLRD